MGAKAKTKKTFWAQRTRDRVFVDTTKQGVQAMWTASALCYAEAKEVLGPLEKGEAVQFTVERVP